MKITIEYCTKCKWHNRAVWYVQELLYTFDGKIDEISLKPISDPPGTFRVLCDDKVIYRKRMKTDAEEVANTYEGFPDSKFLKQLIRNELDPELNLGHIDKYENKGLTDCKECK